jgi:hypothetical protein
MFLFSSISRDYISLQAPCQIFVDQSAWLESSILHSLGFDVQIHFIYLTSQTALMFLIFIICCVLNSIVSYGRSKRVMKIGAFDHRWAFWASQIFYPIVIVVPLYVSKSFRFVKKLTASSGGQLPTF